MRRHLPWRAVPIDELEVMGHRVIEDSKGREIAYVTYEKDAEEIVRCVNTADRLLIAGAVARLLERVVWEISLRRCYVPFAADREALLQDLKLCSSKLLELKEKP